MVVEVVCVDCGRGGGSNDLPMIVVVMIAVLVLVEEVLW